jgi:hypothetical protein
MRRPLGFDLRPAFREEWEASVLCCAHRQCCAGETVLEYCCACFSV